MRNLGNKIIFILCFLVASPAFAGEGDYMGLPSTAQVAGFTFPSTQGTSGQVLESQGDGTSDWGTDDTGAGGEWTDEGAYLRPTDGDEYIATSDTGARNYADGDGDAYIEDELEVDGNSHFLNVYIENGIIEMRDATPTTYFVQYIGIDDGIRFCVDSTNNKANRNFIFTDITNYNKDHGHDTQSPDPRVWGHSVTNVDTDNTEWWSLTHDQTNTVLESGKGSVNIKPSILENGTAVPNTGNNLSVFAATTSAQLAGVLSDETGSGAAVFGINPALDAPTLSNVKKRIYISCTAGIPRNTNGCADAALSESTTNKVNYYTCDFDASTDEFWQFHLTLPENYDAGTFTYAVSWTCTADASKGVAWFLQLMSITNDDTIDTAYGTAIESNDDGIATGDYLLSPESAAVTASGTPAGGHELWGQLYRDVSDSDDDLTTDAKMLGIWLIFGVDALTTED